MALVTRDTHSLLLKIRAHPSYAVLDEYIRWDQDFSTTENGKRASFLDHLNHVYVYQADGKGPSIWEKVLDLLGHCQNGRRDFSWRRLNKDLGTSVTKVWGSKLRCVVDGLYIDPEDYDGGHQTSCKQDAFIHGISTCPSTAESWRISRRSIREITFCQDPAQHHLGLDCHRMHTAKNYNNVGITERSTTRNEPRILAAIVELEVLESWQYSDIMAEAFWDELLARVIPRLPNLESFRWTSTAFVSDKVLERLTRPEHGENISLRNVELVINKIPKPYIIQQPLKKLGRKLGPALEDPETYSAIAQRRLPHECKLSVTLVQAEDSELRPTLDWLGTWTNQVECFTIDRTLSSYKSKASGQGIWKHDNLQPYKSALFRVRQLEVTEVGLSLPCLMSAICPSKLVSLTIKECKSLDAIFKRINNAPDCLKHFAYTAFSHEDRRLKSSTWADCQKSNEHVVDYLRQTRSQLHTLYINGGFEDFGGPRDTKAHAELCDSIQHVCSSLQKLDIVNAGFDFSLEEIQQIVKKSPLLSELGITCSMFRHLQNGQLDAELGHRFKEVIEAFGSDHIPFILTVHQAAIQDEQRLDQEQLNTLLFATNLAHHKTTSLEAIALPFSNSYSTIHPPQQLTFIPLSADPHPTSTYPTRTAKPYSSWLSPHPLHPSSIRLTPAQPSHLLSPAFTHARARIPNISAVVSSPAFSAALGPPAALRSARPQPDNTLPSSSDVPAPLAVSVAASHEHAAATREARARYIARHVDAKVFAEGAVRTCDGFPAESMVRRRKRMFAEELQAQGVDGFVAGMLESIAGAVWGRGFDGRWLKRLRTKRGFTFGGRGTAKQ